MTWSIDFISEDDFLCHVRDTIAKYDNKLKPYDLGMFNKNIIDPIKMLFDKNVYAASWESIISNEIFRQRDKAVNNEIGYFHQRIFQYMPNCHVPDNGKEGGWDVICENPDGIELADGSRVHRIYVEMKNKHNTMNSSASSKTFIKMQNQLLRDDDCACFLVEAIAKKSQDIKWETSVDGQKVGHRLIRRVSMDKFYALITGDEDAFYKICLALPETITKVIEKDGMSMVPYDTVYDELKAIAASVPLDDPELSMVVAFYMLGFNSYSGFSSLMGQCDENMLVKEKLGDYALKIMKAK